MKHFMARVKNPSRNWHAIEIWLDAENIIDAGQDVMSTLAALGISTDDVTRLVEIDEERWVSYERQGQR